MDQPVLPCTTATCSLSWTQTKEHEDCSSLYCEPAISETLVQKSSLVTGVAAISKEQLEKSLLVTGKIEEDSAPQAMISCLKT